MFAFSVCTYIQIKWSKRENLEEKEWGPYAYLLCFTIIIGIIQSILMYYAIQGDNNGVRIFCILFLVLAWISFLAPALMDL